MYTDIAEGPVPIDYWVPQAPGTVAYVLAAGGGTLSETRAASDLSNGRVVLILRDDKAGRSIAVRPVWSRSWRSGLAAEA